jgi:hypothetical protein
MESDMDTKPENKFVDTRFAARFATLGAIVFLSITLSACVVAPTQPMGYRMTDDILPTYVNGQYVGMQPSNYVAPDLGDTQIPSSADFNYSQLPTYSQPTITQRAPAYVPPPVSSVVYVQNPTPVYYPSYNPYYYPRYVDPWFSPGITLGIGFGLGHRHGCCWGSGWGRGRGWRH